MKKLLVSITALCIMAVVSCGPSAEETAKKAKATADSVAAVAAAEAEAAAAKAQAAQDSIAKIAAEA